MLPQRSEVDDYESGMPTPRQAESDREPPTVLHRMTRVPTPARSSVRALYVPSPLPMCELKKAMARADEEATRNSSPAVAEQDDAPPSSAPTRLHGHREPSPFELAQTSLANAQERRLSSNVDADEEKAIGGWRYPIPPLPALEEFAPIVTTWNPVNDGSALPVPGMTLVATTKTETPRAKGSRVRAALKIATASALSVALALVAIGFARGDLTREDAQGAAIAVQRAAIHVVQNVKRL